MYLGSECVNVPISPSPPSPVPLPFDVLHIRKSSMCHLMIPISCVFFSLLSSSRLHCTRFVLLLLFLFFFLFRKFINILLQATMLTTHKREMRFASPEEKINIFALVMAPVSDVTKAGPGPGHGGGGGGDV